MPHVTTDHTEKTGPMTPGARKWRTSRGRDDEKTKTLPVVINVCAPRNKKRSRAPCAFCFVSYYCVALV